VTAIARIVERFTMHLDDKPEDKWFLDYVLRSPRQAGVHLTAGWLAMNSLLEIYEKDDIRSCDEWFGGMGAQAVMVEDLFGLEKHVVGEYSLDAVRHLRSVLPEKVEVWHRDAYDESSFSIAQADLQILDYGDLTIWKLRPGEPRRKLLEYVTGLIPKAILMTDIACRYLHLHRERYETMLGEGSCGDYATYLAALDDFVSQEFGYHVHRAFYDRWSTVMALVPNGIGAEGVFVPTPHDPVGLEIF
jgi:hypothetical protein